MHRSPTRARTVLISLALVASTMVATSLSAEAAAGQAEGIDVSHWQGTINWSSVVGAGKTFAFLKATQGTSYRDPTYATNRTGANTAGIPIGAYHFADVTKDPTNAGGARDEADWFVDTAAPKKGDLPPVFDIETNNGLGQVALTDWAMTWLERVRQRTGIYPMVYTSPSGWNTRFGTPGNVVAESGYGLLWIAHWTTASSPTVPANNWAGNGWTFWQYTSKGTVPGISGRVDLDRYRSADVSSILLRQLTITKDFSSGKSGGVRQDGLGNFCNNNCTGTTRLSVGGATTVLAPQSSDPQTTWIWGGACSGAPTGGTCTLSMTTDRLVTIKYVPAQVLTIDMTGTGNGAVSSSPVGISCTGTVGAESGTCYAPFEPGTSVTLTAAPAPDSSFTGWSGSGCTGAGTCIVTVDGAKTVTASFAALPRVTLTLAAAGMGAGSVTPNGGVACTSSCTLTYPVGTTFTVAQSAATGSLFVGWTGGTCGGTGTCSVTMDTARSVTGWFAPLYGRTVSLSANTTRISRGASVTLSGRVTSSNTVSCPVGGQSVAVTVGTTTVTTVPSASDGSWTVTLQPNATSTYVARLSRGTSSPIGNPVCDLANSSSVKVTVR